jgi:HprK-related kinase A
MRRNLQVGPFSVAVETPLARVIDNIDLHYHHHSAPGGEFYDFHLRLDRPHNLRRWIRPQVQFAVDGHEPFTPLPLPQSYALFEWGLNWCLSVHMHRYLLVHSAVVERNGRLLILPGTPGSGKSTLCAALVSRGWRLFSDEIAVIDPESLETLPIPRPINIKNRSIEVIGSYAPDLQIGEVVADTTKGTVAHVTPPLDSVQRQRDTATPAWVIFPKYTPGSATSLTMMKGADALLALAGNAFNYHIHGARGFECLSRIAREASFAQLTYSDLDDVITKLDQMVAEAS